MLTDNYIPADLAACTGGNDNGGNWWLILLFLFAFGGFGGFGGNQNGAANNYTLASDFATLQRQMSDGFGAMERKGDGIANGLCDGFYAQNTTMLNGFAGLANTVNTNGFETRNAINSANITQMQNANAITRAIENGFSTTNYNAANASCMTNNNICTATRDITENANANTRAILDALTAQRLEDKNAKIAEQAAQINALNLAASQAAQNNYLIQSLRPAPVPAYPVSNPYAASGCGCC